MSIKTNLTLPILKPQHLAVMCSFTLLLQTPKEAAACSPSQSHMTIEWPRYSAPTHTPIWLTLAYLERDGRDSGTFHLRDELGQDVDFEVERFPGSHEFPASELVQLTPSAPLQPNTTYTVWGESDELRTIGREFKTTHASDTTPLPFLSLESIEAFKLEDFQCYPAYWKYAYRIRLEPFEASAPVVKYSVVIDFEDESTSLHGVMDSRNPAASIYTSKTPSCLTLHLTDIAGNTASLPPRCNLPTPQASVDTQTSCALTQASPRAPQSLLVVSVLCFLGLGLRRSCSSRTA